MVIFQDVNLRKYNVQYNKISTHFEFKIVLFWTFLRKAD